MGRNKIDEELQFHIDQQIADYVSAGMHPAEARRRALIEFGGAAQIREECRAVGGWTWLSNFLQDVRYAARMIRKRPVFAAVATVALALGIGANSAVFSVTNGVLLRPLPFQDLDRLVGIRNVDPRRPNVAKSMAMADFIDIRERNKSFERVSAYTFHDFDMSSPGQEPEGCVGANVTWDFFTSLRARPMLGRDFREGEDEPGSPDVVILSNALWRTQFASDPSVAGRTIHLDSRPFQVTASSDASDAQRQKRPIPSGIRENARWSHAGAGARRP
jgi:hypothetical protein